MTQFREKWHLPWVFKSGEAFSRKRKMHVLKARTESSKGMDGSLRELKVSEGGTVCPGEYCVSNVVGWALCWGE